MPKQEPQVSTEELDSEDVQNKKMKVKPKVPSSTEQTAAVLFVSDQYSYLKQQCTKRRRQLNRIFLEVQTFYGAKRADWNSAIKVNHAFRIENSIQSRLTAKNPKFIASLTESVSEIADRYYPITDESDEEMKQERARFEVDIAGWGKAIQTYLNNAFKLADFSAEIRRAAKTLVRYGNVYGTIDYKVKKYNYIDEDGKVSSKEGKEYPVLTTLTYSDVVLDPRYHQTETSPGIIWMHENVRLTELLDQKDELINLDKVKLQPATNTSNEKQYIYQIMFPNAEGQDTLEKCKKLTVKKFYGYYSPTEDPEDERIYEMWTLNDVLLIKFKEIREIPIISTGCFEDPEQHFATGFIEPMLGIQEELDFKRNSANDYINQSLNRSWVYDIQSGIDPGQLIGSRPNALIFTTGNAQETISQHLVEIPHRQIPPEYFSNSNELNRDLQSVSFSVDTNATTSQQGFTNTATGQRIRAFETNTVYSEVLRHFEQWLEKLAYQMLEELRNNMEEDIILEYLGDNNKLLLKKIMLEDAPLRFLIQVEPGSSSFDSIEQRRDDALAAVKIGTDLKAAGANVDLNVLAQRVMGTFEGLDISKVIKPNVDALQNILMGGQAGAPGMPGMPPQDLSTSPSLDNAAELTKAVAGGQVIG